MRLDGKVAIVTGAAGGIGTALAQRFVAEGASVVLGDVNGAQEALAKELGERAVAVDADVATEEGAAALVAAARQQWGRLDILVNNAGIDGTPAPLADCGVEDFDRVLAVNLRGAFLTMRAAIPPMVEGGGGSVINIGSVLARVAVGYLPAYCASKGGLVQLTKSAALGYATAGVRVNVISPGVIRTPMLDAFFGQMPEAAEAAVAQHPVGRIGTPEEVAALAVYLASDEAKFVTGADFAVDGGYTAQ